MKYLKSSFTSNFVSLLGIFSNLGQRNLPKQEKKTDVHLLFCLCLVLGILSLSGCRKPISYVDPVPEKPFPGLSLKVAISDTHPIATELLQQFAKGWTTRSGATVEIVPTGTNNPEADIWIVSPAEVTHWAEKDQLVEIPAPVRQASNAYQWADLPVSSTDKICRWKGKAYGMPILGEGHLLVYRSDLFAQHNRTVPETWEEFVDTARFFYQQAKTPSLVPLSKNDLDLDQEFYTIAVNYDRRAIYESNLGRGPSTADEEDLFFSFHFRLNSTTPRINQNGFVHALSLMQKMQDYRPSAPSEDPAEAFRSGKAVMHLAPLSALARFQADDSPVKNKVGIALIPGSRFVFDLRSGEKIDVVPSTAINRVPYIGWGGAVGVVSKKCTHLDAAFDFLGQAGHPVTTSLEWIGAAKWGAGPFRISHLEQRNRSNWFGFGFGVEETDKLVEILRQNAGPNVANYTVALRVPDEKTYRKIVTDSLRKALFGGVDPRKTLDDVAEQWKKLNLKADLYRFSLGL